MKIILIVIDGLGDRPIPDLGNKTPLGAAKTPNLDWLAEKGICGLVKPWQEQGKLPTSEDTHLALLGYEPRYSNPGRGVFEAFGIGMRVLPGDVCLRGNFATVDKKMKIIDRRAGRIEKTLDLIRKISRIEVEGIKFLIGKAVSHRIGIVMRGKNLISKISNGDPKKEGVKPLKIRPLDKSKQAEFTARVLNQFLTRAHSILKDHPLNKKRKLPANYILVRGAGSPRKISTFFDKYKLRACCIAGGTLYKGIGKFLGMDPIEVKGATGLPNTNIKGKFLAAKRALNKYDFVFYHIKAADNLAEDGNFRGKRDFIEKIDKNIKLLTPPFLKRAGVLIVVTADHSTCCSLKRHCSEPIPLLIYGKESDNIKTFSEKACKKGKLGVIKQINLMKKIHNLCSGI